MRFKIVSSGSIGEDDEEKEKWTRDTTGYFLFLVDTTAGKAIFNYRMEPEDASLPRDLGPLVDKLNELANEVKSLKEQLYEIEVQYEILEDYYYDDMCRERL